MNKKRKYKYQNGGNTPDPETLYQDSLNVYNNVESYNIELSRIHKMDDLKDRALAFDELDKTTNFNSKILPRQDKSKGTVIGVNPEKGKYYEMSYLKLKKPTKPISKIIPQEEKIIQPSSSNEQKYQEWRSKLPKNLQYEGDYDLKGFYEENPNFSISNPNQHLTDKYKLPNHPTFSNESKYYKFGMKAGKWENEKFIPIEQKNIYTMPDGKKYTEQQLIQKYPQMKYKSIKKANFPNYKKGGYIIPKYQGGGFARGFGDFTKTLADTALTPFEAIAGDFYDPKYETEFGKEKLSKINSGFDKVISKAAPALAGVAGTVLGGPVVGALASTGTKALQEGVSNAVTTPGEKESMIDRSVPNQLQQQALLDNPDLTYNMGGMTPMTTIEVEKNELETDRGKVLKDFRKYRTHEKGGFTYNALPNRTIIPSKLRNRYLEGDKNTRTTIETNLINDQMKREGIIRKAQNGMYIEPTDTEFDPFKASRTLNMMNLEDPQFNPYESLQAPRMENTGTNNNYISQALQLAPLAYNTIRGLQKPETLNQAEFQNPYESTIRSLYSNRRINMKPIRDDINRSYRAEVANLGAGDKSSGQVLSGASALFGQKLNAMSKSRMQEQDLNNQYRGDEATALSNLGSQRAKTKLGIKDMNLRSRAARNAMLGQAAVEGQKFSNADQYNDIIGNMFSDLYTDYKFNPITRRYEYKTK